MIRGREYKFISDNLAAAQGEGLPMYHALGEMLRTLNDNELDDDNVEKRDIRLAIEDAYLIVLQKHVGVSSEMARMVGALQNHVSHHFGSVDEFLPATGIKVSADFASLSSLVGFEISAEHIE